MKKIDFKKDDLNTIVELHCKRTEEILSNPYLVDKVNYRKRSPKSKVSLNGINKPICEDGILNRGTVEYKNGSWTRNSNGHEFEDYMNLLIKIVVVSKDSNEGVEEDEDTTTLGCAWDIRNETLRSNNSEEIRINATFAKNYMKIITILVLLHRSCNEAEILKTLDDIDECRKIWEDAKIARINLKKQPGNGSISDSLLSSYISLYEEVLTSQVKLLDPKIIINSSGKPGLGFLKRIYKGLKCIDEECGGWIYFDNNYNVLIIDVYHFSWLGWNRGNLHYYKVLIDRLGSSLKQIENLEI